MKNTFKTVGFFMLILAIAFSAIACDGDGGGGGGGGPGGGGNNYLKITNIDPNFFTHQNIIGYFGFGLYSPSLTNVAVETDIFLLTQGQEPQHFTAGCNNDGDDIQADAQLNVTMPLYAVNGNNWTGTGNYNVWMVAAIDQNNYFLAKTKTAVNFNGGTTTINAKTLFEVVEVTGFFNDPAWTSHYDDDGSNGNGGNGEPGGNGGNNEPKTLIVTGITQAQLNEGSEFSVISIFPQGTSAENVEADLTAYFNGQSTQFAVAGMDLHQTAGPVPVGPTFTITVPLYAANSTTTRWTGYGTFDVYNIVCNDNSRIRNYLAANVSFTSASTQISATSYNLVWDSEEDNNGPELDVPYSNMPNFGEWRKLDIRNATNQEVYYGYAKANLDGTVTFSTQRATDNQHVTIVNGNYVINIFVFGKDVTYANYDSLPAQGLDGDDAVAQYVYISNGQSLAGLGITDETSFMTNFNSLLTNIPTQVTPVNNGFPITLQMLTNFRRMW